jgi:uncharacterized peroxidase-related enzyme
MSRIAAIDPAQTEGKTRETLNAVNKMLGATPNLFRVAAQSPSVLEGLVGMIGAASHGTLKASTREAIALTVAEANGCDYCLSAHTVLGKGAGLSEADANLARDAASPDAKTAAMLRFARAAVLERGQVGAAGLAALKQAGVSDAEALEVVANVVVNIFTNYLNLVADTDIDFPVVRAKAAR